MRVEAFAIRLRSRDNSEAADLGVRLCQSTARSVYRCLLFTALPVIALCLATVEIATWLPAMLIWASKPWFDRTILFVLSRAAFGESTTFRDVWADQRQVWWGQFFRTWIVQRLSPWRSLSLPVVQLEGLKGTQLSERVKTIRLGKARSAGWMTGAFSLVENILFFSLLSLTVWFAPRGHEPDYYQMLLSGDAESAWISLAFAAAYSLVVLFLEPFYVGAGFALYLNRRVELEAWDIEQEFRRAFAPKE